MRFLFYEIWSILYSKYLENLPKRDHKFQINKFCFNFDRDYIKMRVRRF